MHTKNHGRRQFLKGGAAVAGLAMGAFRSASGQTLGSETPALRPKDLHSLGERSHFEEAKRTADVVLGTFWLSPIQDQVGIITPSALHYSHVHYGIPDLDPNQHRLMIHGLVEHPYVLSLEDLKRLPSVTRVHSMECFANGAWSRWKSSKTAQEAFGRLSGSEWTGVPLSLLLKEAGVQKEASWIIAESADGGKWMRTIPLDKVMDDVLVAYGQNGEAIRPEQGYPLRLLVPGWQGAISVKWLRRIKVVDQPYLEGVMASVSKSPEKARSEFEQSARSVITYPSGGHRLSTPGFYEITGLAWSGRGAIRKVEVSTDGGKTWKDAQLQDPVHTKALTLFRLPWNWNGEEAVLQSRCTDELGAVQPALAEFSKDRGVSLDYWQTNRMPAYTNPIFSWEVTRDGSVQNAMV